MAPTWFRLHTAGRYDQGSVRGSAAGQATYDFPVVITGTDQPGYAVVFFETNRSADVIAPTRYQWVAFSGTGLPSSYPVSPGAGYGYIPYTPGVPFQLSAIVQEFGGNAAGDQRGEFEIDFALRIVGFMTHFPEEGEPWQLSQIEGAQAVVVPESVSLAFAAAGLALAAIGTYASPRARPRST